MLTTLTLATAFSSLAQAQPQQVLRILAFGNSLTAGYGVTPDESFPAQLQQTLQQRGLNVEVINSGVSGDTTTGGLARLDWALSDNPDAVIIELGANDGLRAIDPNLTRDNLSKMLGKLQEKQLPVLLTGMLAPPNLGSEYSTAFNSIFPELAEQYSVLFYPFFLDGVATIAELNQADGIHPTPAGIAVIVERILPSVLQLLEQAGLEVNQ